MCLIKISLNELDFSDKAILIKMFPQQKRSFFYMKPKLIEFEFGQYRHLLKSFSLRKNFAICSN